MIQRIDYQTWLAGCMNVKVDRASMACSLEVREPLMDHRLVEWAMTLPSALKIRGQEGKYLLKRAFEPDLPRDVLYRPKMGFSTPISTWLRGPLREPLGRRLRDPALLDAGIFDPERLTRMYDEHCAGSRDWSSSLWSILVLGEFLHHRGAGVGAATERAAAATPG
ncbi:MAG: asparagine synthase-related protein [Burkholderiaceae bacterium]